MKYLIIMCALLFCVEAEAGKKRSWQAHVRNSTKLSPRQSNARYNQYQRYNNNRYYYNYRYLPQLHQPRHNLNPYGYQYRNFLQW